MRFPLSALHNLRFSIGFGPEAVYRISTNGPPFDRVIVCDGIVLKMCVLLRLPAYDEII
jgi:hypothetical protein